MNSAKTTASHYGTGHIKRLRKRFNEGKVSKEELVELLLSYVIKGKDVKPQARALFRKAGGSYREIFRAVKTADIMGIGSEAKTFFAAIESFTAQHARDGYIGKKYSIKGQSDVIDYHKILCAGEKREQVHAVFLNAKNRVIESKKMCEGTVTQSALYPREIIAEAIAIGGVSIVIIHNHPSGDVKPSESDIKITRKLLFSMKEMELCLLDHIIVGSAGYFSFYEEGLIERFNAEHRRIQEAAAR